MNSLSNDSSITPKKGQRGASLMELVISLVVIGMTFAALAYQMANAMATAHWPLQSTQTLFLAKESFDIALGQYEIGSRQASAVQPVNEAPIPGFPHYSRIVEAVNDGTTDCDGGCIEIQITISEFNSGKVIRRLNGKLYKDAAP